MTRKQSNQLYMGQTVLGHLEKFPQTWNTYPKILPVADAFKTTVSELFLQSKRQEENNTPGFTRNKDNEMEKLVEATYQLLLKARSFAKIKKDEVVLESVKYAYSALEVMSAVSLYQASQIISGHARANFAEVSEFGVTEEQLTALEALQAEVSNLVNQRAIAGSTRKSATDNIADLISQMREQLDLLDDMLEAFVTDQEFLSVYSNLRKIVDRTGRGGQQPKVAVN